LCRLSRKPTFTPSYKEVVKSKIDQYVIDKVKEKRIERNLSQADLAYELGMSVGFIGKVESVKYSTHYNLKHLNDLAKVLKCSPQDFLPKKPF
jgi:transcriptional regulator with XRE-family HTH domain